MRFFDQNLWKIDFLRFFTKYFFDFCPFSEKVHTPPWKIAPVFYNNLFDIGGRERSGVPPLPTLMAITFGFSPSIKKSLSITCYSKVKSSMGESFTFPLQKRKAKWWKKQIPATSMPKLLQAYARRILFALHFEPMMWPEGGKGSIPQKLGKFL